MKNLNCTDKSTPYRTNKGGKITAPNKPQDEPKSSVIKAKGDMRGGK